MNLPVERILWAPTNSAHDNHLHVVGEPRRSGHPPHENPGMTDSIAVIVAALDEEFGPGAYWQYATAENGWTHMGIWNRRYIGGTTTWSQHAYANAIDIGPYYGVEQQQKFYDFLTGKREEGPVVPINQDSHKEEIRVAQGRLGVAETGDWDSVTASAVKNLAIRASTGDPKGLDGTHINGRMYNQLTEEFVRSVAGSGGVTESQVVQAIQNHAGDPDAHHE